MTRVLAAHAFDPEAKSVANHPEKGSVESPSKADPQVRFFSTSRHYLTDRPGYFFHLAGIKAGKEELSGDRE